MNRMLHKPDLSLEDRMAVAEGMSDKIMNLLKNGWTDTSIAGYVGLDQYTIRRFRKRHEIVGKRSVRCPHYSYIQ